MKSHKITGGAGAQLHVVESGSAEGRPILYIHGFSQCSQAWRRQLHSDLAGDHRLVAMDMRGHGLSDKPAEGYDDTKLWAEDVKAVIDGLNLAQPVLCGWSYGGVVILDYIRHFGSGQIGGVHLVGAVTKLGREAAEASLSPEFLALIPGFFSTEAGESTRSLEALLRLCFVQQPSSEEWAQMLEYNVSVPSFVRRGLFTRTVDNDDLLTKLEKPVLITHGAQDAIVKPETARQHKALMPHAELQMMDNSGHAPFWDEAASFNQRQRAFALNLGRKRASN
jgi:pimeloyl-ACP methyl ester carboxylesterase